MLEDIKELRKWIEMFWLDDFADAYGFLETIEMELDRIIEDND